MKTYLIKRARSLCLATACAFLTSSLCAKATDLIAKDSFEYDAGLLHPNFSNGGEGWTGSWENARGMFVADDEESLVPPINGFTVSGSRLSQTGEGNADRRFPIDFASTPEIWISWLLKKDDNGPSHDFLTLLILPEDSASPLMSAGITSDERFRIAAGVQEGVVGGAYSTGETVLVICKLALHDGSLEASIFLVEAGAELSRPDQLEALATDSGVLDGDISKSILRLRIQQGENAKGELDELRIGKTLQAVLQ